MDLFHIIDDASAIVRTKSGVFKQAKVYHRGTRIFVGVAGGFARVTAKFGSEWGTSTPAVKVIDLEGDGIDMSRSEPAFAPALKAVA